MVRQLSRREVLALAGIGVLSACTPAPSPSPKSMPTRATQPSAGDWQQLGRTIKGRLYQPGDADFSTARLVENPRYDNNFPLAVVSVKSADDLSTTIAFAQDHAIPIAVRSGGHSYPGYSAGGAPGTGVPASLVLDCRKLNSVTTQGDSTATIGAGAALAPVYESLGTKGRGIAGGSCATVGIGGLTLGGGVGVLVRNFGLTCDSVLAMEVVTADRKVRTVSPQSDPDLFWALRGGGGGHLGVVTSFTMKTFAAPTMRTFFMTWPITSAAEVIDVWQSWAPHADNRLWSTLKLLTGKKHPDGPIVLMSGTWLGLDSQLDAQLAGLLNHVPSPSNRSTSSMSYAGAMMAYAGCSRIPIGQCDTGAGGSLDRESFAATSHVAYDKLAVAGIDDVVSRLTNGSSALTEAGISMDALGGLVMDLGPSDTAFVHREALMTVQYTATFANGDSFSPAADYVRGFRSAMLPHWGNHAYVNYADQAVTYPANAYFGANAATLRRVKKEYDPHNFFNQPQAY